MDETQRQIYCSLVTRCAEEPVREVLKGIWSLPFVADTIESCSGHVVVERDLMQRYDKLSEKNIEKLWYRNNPQLEILYSLDTHYAAKRDEFREQLKGIQVESEYGVLAFDDVRESVWPGDHTSGSVAGFSLPERFRLQGDYLKESYFSDFVMEEKIVDAVLKTEALFGLFWDEVAKAVTHYNSSLGLESAVGTNFRKSIDWANWKCSQVPAFLSPEQKDAYRRLQEQGIGFLGC